MSPGKTREIVWGRSATSKRVHIFVDGKRQCISSRGEPREAYEVFPDWNPADPLTCRKCRERHFWLMKGAVRVPRTQRTA